ncbi:23S rRNA (adenine(2503)-C2)-methyltransferase, partial [Paenibacillus riograndensis]
RENREETAGRRKTVVINGNRSPVNHVPERKYGRTSRNEIFEFQRSRADHGVKVTIRREQGHDIAAACGQLRAKHMEKLG